VPVKPRSQVNEVFLRVFEKLYGVPCCGAKREDRDSLTLDFGKPRFAMREIDLPSNVSLKQKSEIARRAIYVRGDWRLILHSGRWKILSKNGRVLLRSTSAETQTPSKYLAGDALVKFLMNVENVESIFHFDSGRRLISQPDPQTQLQWTVHEPWRTTLALRQTLQYSYYSDDRNENLRVWKKVRG
jgi:hypothetical protein